MAVPFLVKLGELFILSVSEMGSPITNHTCGQKRFVAINCSNKKASKK